MQGPEEKSLPLQRFVRRREPVGEGPIQIAVVPLGGPGNLAFRGRAAQMRAIHSARGKPEAQRKTDAPVGAFGKFVLAQAFAAWRQP